MDDGRRGARRGPLEISRSRRWAIAKTRRVGSAPVALCGIFSGTRSGTTNSATSLRSPSEDELSTSWCLYPNDPGLPGVTLPSPDDDGVTDGDAPSAFARRRSSRGTTPPFPPRGSGDGGAGPSDASRGARRALVPPDRARRRSIARDAGDDAPRETRRDVEPSGTACRRGFGKRENEIWNSVPNQLFFWRQQMGRLPDELTRRPTV